MSNSVRPHRWQPTRLPHPWDSPGKNTGVGCHFLLQCRKVKSEREVAQSSPTLRDPMDCSLPGSSVHGIFQARVLEWGAIAFSITESSVLKSYITDYFIFLCSCIFLIYVPLRTCVRASVHAKCSVMSNSAALRTTVRQAPLSMGSPGKNTGVSCLDLLQGIFPTQGSDLHLLHCQWILYH